MLLWISKGFRRRRDYEARQELGFDEQQQNQERSAANPEQPLDRQLAPDPAQLDASPSLLGRLWRALTGR